MKNARIVEAWPISEKKKIFLSLQYASMDQ